VKNRAEDRWPVTWYGRIAFFLSVAVAAGVILATANHFKMKQDERARQERLHGGRGK